TPNWIRAASTEAQELEAVGQAPATLNPKRDIDVATRDAKAQIAARLASRVVSRASDWSVSNRNTESQSVERYIEVRTDVRVENAHVVKTYRDSETKMQYVNVSVDRGAWAARLFERLAAALE